MTAPAVMVRPRWPLLDGLRGLAVLIVVVYHLGIPPFRHGGFLGVEIFFVLSGFLITSLLVGEWTAVRRISLRSFYGRRFVRLYPAQFVVSVGVIVLATLFAAPESKNSFYAGALSTLVYIGNWVKAFALWGQGALTHTWSLAIEEQYYLIWPLIAIAALRRGGTRTLATVSLAMAALFTLVRALMFVDGATLARMYNGTDTRAPALLIGSAAGALLAGGHWTPRIPTWIVSAGVAVCVIASVVVTETRSSIALWLIPFDVLLVVVIVGAALTPTSSVIGRLLTSSIATWLGRLSYSLYLWHKVVIVLVQSAEIDLGPVGTPLLMTAVFVPMSIASYYLVERPFLRLRTRFEQPCLVPVSASPASKIEPVSASFVSD